MVDVEGPTLGEKDGILITGILPERSRIIVLADFGRRNWRRFGSRDTSRTLYAGYSILHNRSKYFLMTKIFFYTFDAGRMCRRKISARS